MDPLGKQQRSTSPSSSSEFLIKPLVVAVGVSRRPEFYVSDQLSDDLWEEGDILFPEENRVTTSDFCGLQPALCLPQTVGSYYTGESFKCLVSVINAAPYALRELLVNVESLLPNKSRLRLGGDDAPALTERGVLTIFVELPLSVSGLYTVEVRGRCVDPAGFQRELSWSTTVLAQPALKEEFSASAERICVPLHDLNLTAVTQSTEVYGVHASLSNLTNSFINLTQCSLELLPSSPYSILCPTRVAEGKASPGNYFSTSNPEHLSLPPGKAQHFTFYVSVASEHLRHVPVKRVGTSSYGVITSRIGELGVLRWSWERHKGDEGSAASSPIVISGFREPSSVEIFLQSIGRLAGSCSESVLPHVGEPTSLKGYVVDFTATLSNKDIFLRICPEKLTPDWLYTGSTVMALDDSEPLEVSRSTAKGPERTRVYAFEVSLTPWRAGDLAIAYGALEVVSSESQCVLWPHQLGWVQEKTSTYLSSDRFSVVALEPKGSAPVAVISVR